MPLCTFFRGVRSCRAKPWKPSNRRGFTPAWIRVPFGANIRSAAIYPERVEGYSFAYAVCFGGEIGSGSVRVALLCYTLKRLPIEPAVVCGVSEARRWHWNTCAYGAAGKKGGEFMEYWIGNHMGSWKHQHIDELTQLCALLNEMHAKLEKLFFDMLRVDMGWGEGFVEMPMRDESYFSDITNTMQSGRTEADGYEAIEHLRRLCIDILLDKTELVGEENEYTHHPFRARAEEYMDAHPIAGYPIPAQVEAYTVALYLAYIQETGRAAAIQLYELVWEMNRRRKAAEEDPVHITDTIRMYVWGVVAHLLGSLFIRDTLNNDPIWKIILSQEIEILT